MESMSTVLMQQDEWHYISMDATLKLCMKLMGQASYRSPKHVRDDAPFGDELAWRRLLTVRGRTGAVLMMQPLQNESAEQIVDALVQHFSVEQLGSVVHIGTVIAVNAALSTAGKAANWLTAVGLLLQMEVELLQKSSITDGAALSAFVFARSWRQALCQMEDIRQPNGSLQSLGLAALAAAGRWEQALAMLVEVLDVDVRLFNEVLGACARRGHWEAALAVLAMLPARSLAGTVVSFTTAIDACSLAGQWQQAAALLEPMAKSEAEANVITFNALIGVCGQGSAWSRGLDLLNEMQVAAVRQDHISTGACVSGAARAWMWEEATELVAALPSQQLRGDVVIQSAAVCACGEAERWRQAMDLFAMREFLNVSTTLTVVVLCAATLLLSEAPAFTAGVTGHGAPQHNRVSSAKGAATFASAHEALGTHGVLCFGMGFGALVAVGRGLAARRAQGSDIAVKEAADISKIAYLQDVDIPRTIVEKDALELILKNTPRDQWENPPEDSYLYTVKAFAEMYGPGKATKMGWWDYYRLKMDMPDTTRLNSERELQEIEEYEKLMMSGKVPFAVPGPSGYFFTGFVTQWKGKEPFAGDQVITLTENGLFAKQFLSALAFYREGLKPWQRGLEIGMAHGDLAPQTGYFLIGPFTSLGPLRNTPEAATVGLLCGCAIVGIVSIGGLIFGSTIKPTRFDKDGDKPGAGFIEMINWHAVGGLGGAGFAHALITVFDDRALQCRLRIDGYGDGSAQTAAISACAEVGQWQRAAQLQRCGLEEPGDVAIFGATLSAAAASWPQALTIQVSLQDAGLQGNTITLNSLAQAFQFGMQWQRAVMLQECWATSEGDPLAYSTLFQACALAAAWPPMPALGSCLRRTLLLALRP
eukprot:s1266_g13.t2